MTQQLLKQQSEINKALLKIVNAKGGEKTAMSHTLGVLVEKFDRAIAAKSAPAKPSVTDAPSLENFPSDGTFLTDMDVIARSVDWRKQTGLNQADFWTIFGVTQSGGSRYENGRTIPRPTCMLMMSVALGHVRASFLRDLYKSEATEQ